jgi:hypothetical protein
VYAIHAPEARSTQRPSIERLQSPGRLWLCDGHGNLYANFIGRTGNNEQRQLVNMGHLGTRQLPVPKPVFDRLPESMRRILPAPETPVVRPSI